MDRRPRFDSRRAIALLVAAAAIATPAAPAGARLSGQTTRGLHRICLYGGERITGDLARRGVAPRSAHRQREVGLGEPCPPLDPGPPRPVVVPIPSLAVLAEDRPTATGRMCIYSYASRRYARTIAAARRCPMTPHFLD
jgi:hypothetical protein